MNCKNVHSLSNIEFSSVFTCPCQEPVVTLTLLIEIILLLLHLFLVFFYVHVTVHRNKFLYNKTNQMHQFPKFTPA